MLPEHQQRKRRPTIRIEKPLLRVSVQLVHYHRHVRLEPNLHLLAEHIRLDLHANLAFYGNHLRRHHIPPDKLHVQTGWAV
jgi:hypothetical protein